MRKKGFTLIELLAVIVILAIIALIATPTILNVIEKARKGATEQSALGYIDAIEKQIMINDTNNIQELKDGTYLVEDINISYKGKGPTKGTVTIKKGEVTTTNLCFKTYSVDYDGTKATISNNNYCKEDKVILKEKENINEIAIENKKAVIDLTNYTDYTNIHCNNNAKLEIENNQLIVTNIIGEVTCQLDKTLEDTFSNLDDSSNSVMMLSDETLSNGITIEKNKNVTLDLNGKTISSTTDTIKNYGNLVIDSQNNFGTITSTGKNSKVIFNTTETANLIIHNGYIKGTENCDTWSCSPLYNTVKSNLEVTPLTINKFDEQNNYVNGVYVESHFGIAMWLGSLSNATINGGIYNVIKTSGSWQHLVCSNCNLLTINYAKTIGDGISIRKQSINGDIIVNDGIFESVGKSVVVTDPDSQGEIVINGGKFISKNNFGIVNDGLATIKIIQTNKPIYISTQAKIWSPAIVNNFEGLIEIKGKKADQCTNNSEDTKIGLCIYAEGDKNYSQNTANGGIQNKKTGTINLDGGTIYGGQQGINNSSTGIFNVKNSEIKSGYWGILNYTTGTINICSSDINSNHADFYNTSTGVINYSPDVVFTNKTNTPIISVNKGTIKSNYLGDCN